MENIGHVFPGQGRLRPQDMKSARLDQAVEEKALRETIGCLKGLSAVKPAVTTRFVF